MDSQNINLNLPESVGNTCQEIYEDTLQPITQPTGELVGLVPQAIRAALLPLEKWIMHRTFERKKLDLLLTQKLQEIDSNRIVQPEPYVAVPALLAISYSQDNETLRNLYANLLARAMVIDTKDNIHPAFVEIIKQLSPVDAQFFKTVCEADLRPVIKLMAVIENKTQTIGLSLPSTVKASTYLITSWSKHSYEQQNLAISNLIRLGLFDPIAEGRPYSNDTNYDSVRDTEMYQELKEQLLVKFPETTVLEDKSCLTITPLGIFFYENCVLDL